MGVDVNGATARVTRRRVHVVCLTLTLFSFCAVSDLLVATAKSQTPQARPPSTSIHGNLLDRTDAAQVAQTQATPQPTPTPAPAQQDATRPPGGEQNQPAPPAPRGATQNPTAPPGSGDLALPQTPPGEEVVPKPNVTGQPTQTPEANKLLNELKQDPLMRLHSARPTPPVPAVTRVGVESGDVLTLSLNDAIRRALENNPTIAVARGDVRVNEGTLVSLEGAFDPVFNLNPQYTSSVTPTTSSVGGGGSSGTVSQNSVQFNSSVTDRKSTRLNSSHIP